MWETILVGLIVLVAILYAIWRLSPAGLRLRTAHRIGEWDVARAVQPGCRTLNGVEAAPAGGRACSACSAAQADPAAPPRARHPRLIAWRRKEHLLQRPITVHNQGRLRASSLHCGKHVQPRTGA